MNFNGYLKALMQSLLMISVSGVLAILLGFLVAIVLIYTKENGLKPKPVIYNVLDFIINLFRSFPFIILMIMLFPLARFVVGTAIGTTAAIVPLTIAAIPFAARIIEGSLNTVDAGIIEAAKSFGAKNSQIIFRVMLVEALPNLVQGITNIFINIVGYSAMAGTIGGEGLGQVAINYGYYRWNDEILAVTVVIIFLVVQVIQTLGNRIYRQLIR
ncbi:ABC transporter permease [Proteiniclasticum sp. BAD-10]|uniref:ABC transporter permease n=1 Tax=Proteiniclasticum sediminis TaxID=2804028 RepID=A0A941CN99_9CLOT|nr:methionine ABC transporter permease [Proteiniclasticum sediminis]MBR0574823.1 ABC transporter permease [Proteiniclasticum sediminis]